MLLKVIATGSTGNCYKLESNTGHQLMLDAGIKYDRIALEFDFSKLDGAIISHVHSDHSLSKGKLEMCGVDIYSHENLRDGVAKQIGNEWTIMPCSVPHGNVDCFSYIIYNKVEKKYIYYATDCTRFVNLNPNLVFDLLLVECNYQQEIVLDCMDKITNSGYLNHMNLNTLYDWVTMKTTKPKNIVTIHGSNSGLIDYRQVLNKMKETAENVYIGKPKFELLF